MRPMNQAQLSIRGVERGLHSSGVVLSIRGWVMRIGFDARALSVRSSGIRTYTYELLRGLAEVDADNEYVLYGLPRGSKPTGLPSRFSEDSRLLPARHLTDRLVIAGQGRSLDLYHGTNYAAPQWSSFPTVLTVHDLTVYLFPENHPRLRRVAHRFLPRLCRNAAYLIADSENTRRDLVRCYGISPEQVGVVHLAAGPEFQPMKWSPDFDRVRSRYRLPDEFVLYFGTLDRRKNLPLLIRAIGELHRRGVPRTLVIAGVGESSVLADLHTLTRDLGLMPGEDIVFTGIIEESDVPILYNLCDLFVYPSSYEGFGLPPLEAMATGSPVVVSNASSFPELYEGKAVLVELGSAEALAEAIDDISRDEAKRKFLVDRGLEFARSRSWVDVARETLDVYQRVEDTLSR